MLTRAQTAPNDLEAFWMPFTANRHFKAHPRLIARAHGMHYTMTDGRQLLDATAGLWCCNAGHANPRIVEAIQLPGGRARLRPGLPVGHPKAFELASRLAHLLPGDLDHAFFTNSGSESVDTSLKIALAYQRAIGQGTRTRLIGRERGYHGVGFGGISVGGHRQEPHVLRLACSPAPTTSPTRWTWRRNAFSRGLPEHGAELADELERLVALHDASTIAAVIVEPVAGSIGVYPPPAGYLQRLREITSKHGILLIFDEVITAFGRLGTATGGRVFRRAARPHDHGQGPDLGHRADGRVMAVRKPIHDAIVHGAGAGPRRRSSCSTAIPTPRIRSPAPPPWPRSRRLPARSGCSSARRSSRPIGRSGCIPWRGRPTRDRHPQHRPDGRRRLRARDRASPASAPTTPCSRAARRASCCGSRPTRSPCRRR